MISPQPVDKARPHRSESWGEQTVPTYHLLKSAIEAGERKTCVDLIDYADHEWAGLNFGFYTIWAENAISFLVDNGVSQGDIEGLEGDLKVLVNTFWEPDVPYDRWAELARYRILKAKLLRELNAPVAVALKTLQEWKECWRSIHDRDTDYASGLLNMVTLRFGEETLETLFRSVIGERFNFRYAKYDVSQIPWERGFNDLVHASIETQRGHLVGPNREGEVEVIEHDDKVVITFEPCGTGGRTIAGDALAGTPSRHDAPFYYTAIKGQHDFAWNRVGVCQYCTHCAMMTGKFPIERFGYPLRVVEPPLAGDLKGRCNWTIYRDLRDVPEHYYRSLGHAKPAPDAPLGSAGRVR